MKSDDMIDRKALHEMEMAQGTQEKISYKPVILHKLWNKHETVIVGSKRGGHGGGDERLHDHIFKTPNADDPYKHAAGSRDGAMSILIGIAARKSIESGNPVRIAELTDLQPRAKRIYKRLLYLIYNDAELWSTLILKK